MSLANPASSAANLVRHPMRLLTVLIRALLVVFMVAGPMLEVTAANMRALHASEIMSQPASTVSAGMKLSCPNHDKKTDQHCPQTCCGAICGFCSLATLSTLDSAGVGDRIAKLRVATSEARHTGIEVGFDPPPPRVFG